MCSVSVLRAENVTKVYPGTVALDAVSLSFESGKVNALIGKNGSGKSTLVKIISGAEQATEGHVYLDDKKLSFKNPMDAFGSGIATVYQELSLVQGMTAAENILIGRLPEKRGFIDWKATYKQAEDLIRELDVDIAPDAYIYELSVWQCQMLEIVKAMSYKPRVLLLDEPTSALAQNEVASLFKMVRLLKEKDVIVIYISHKLHELWEIADTCTVLRDGKYRGAVEMASVTRKEVLGMMFGDLEIKQRPADLRVDDEVVLSVKGLSRKPRFTDVSFDLRKGEVLGIAGMLGAGRTELLRALFGADQADAGTVTFNGQPVTGATPEKMRDAGVALTPEDRKREGLNLIASIKDNLCYASLPLISDGYFVNRKREDGFAGRQIADLQIKLSSALDPMTSLSGGNQQKVVVGNWLNIGPKVMLFDEPSRGIDVNAKQQIFQIIWEQSRRGISSIMVSSELEELIEVCHRILIMRAGRIVDEVRPENITIEELYSLCMGAA
ncbi:putative ribose/galactose/methyl galactoside import ATP-binding protein 1 [Spirochaetia bacterium]|nr:putative ribose/galactose/methyl galactoside import ATP-binding protein 1 [Spirochaetia bacterium]